MNFTGRAPFPEVRRIYARSLATVLLSPARYAAAGQVTQRIFESAQGCVPLTPSSLYRAAEFVPDVLVVRSGEDVLERLVWLRSIAGSGEHAELLADCLRRLDLFRLSPRWP